jgi:hypothetical protein
MKKLPIAFIIFTLYLIFSARVFYSQSETTVQDILEMVNTKVTQLEENKKLEVVNITVDLLANQGTKSITRVLDPNFEYTLFVIGDRRISKLRLSLYIQGKGNKEFVNETSGLSPSLKVIPDEFCVYEITVGAQEFKGIENAGHFAILIYHGDALKK